MQASKPWLRFYGSVPESIDYPPVTLYDAVAATARKYPEAPAYDFMGFTSTYRRLVSDIDCCANGLAGLGLRQGDRITIAMPTTPQGVICFYAANKLGAVASMIHPLSTPSEIEFYLDLSQSKLALTLNAFYAKFKEAMTAVGPDRLILAEIPDYLPPLTGLAFRLLKGRKIPKVPADDRVVWWREVMRREAPEAPTAPMATHDLAVILYSGGTTGKPKGIMLSNANFIAEGLQCAHWVGMDKESSILAILPIFHGFGLGVCVNAAFMGGGKSILVPTFTPEAVAKLIKRKRPTFVVGVPTLFDALSRNEGFRRTDLSCLKAAFCGADTLPRVVKERFEAVVRSRGGRVKLLEGYGLTEAVTGIMATPLNEYREGSIGVPFPDMRAKIVRLDSIDDAPVGQEGEICISGPAVMLGYLNQPAETARALRTHADGRVWLHTGDIGTMDEDGFFYFKLRQKRLIKSSGMNVYPAQVEELLYKHPEVAEACVIGVPDARQVERVKAFVVLKDKSKSGPAMETALIEHCQKDLIKWSCPREIEFRDSLPLTLVGKVAYKVLQDEEMKKPKTEDNVQD
ncbi:MAG: AMP-binding protein [Desulfobacterales bacterium]